jgi:hypothetical protein
VSARAYRTAYSSRAICTGPLPERLPVGLQHDALAEEAALALISPGIAYQEQTLSARAVGRQNLDLVGRAYVRRWSRGWLIALATASRAPLTTRRPPADLAEP